MKRTIDGLSAGMVLALAVVLAGCTSSEGEGLDLQDPTAAPTTAPTTADPSAEADPAPSSGASSVPAEPSAAVVSAEEQAVLDAYAAFYAALDQAQADPPRSQDHLAPVATGIQFEVTNGTIKAAFLDGVESLGSPVLNPTVASIDGDIALVHDCQDTSDVQTRQKETGEVLTIGTNPASATIQLTRVDGAWKVSGTEFQKNPQEYCA